MPTANPRINVTLSPSLDSLVSQLAGMQKVSKSTVLRELLETAEPALRQLVALMGAASTAKMSARQKLASDLSDSVKAAEGAASLVLRDLASRTRDLAAEAEAIQGRRPAGAARQRRGGSTPAKRPPSSNRGVKS